MIPGATDPRRADELRLLSRVGALGVIAVALLVLLGWWLGLELLTSLYATIAMNPLTAVCFLLAAASLFAASRILRLSPATAPSTTRCWAEAEPSPAPERAV